MRQLAVKGGVPYKTKPFPVWPFYNERELQLVTEVVKSQKWWRMSGSKVDEFEKQFSGLHDAEYCLGVSNGTHAIELTLAALGIGKGDEVIVPAFTFISTATAPIYCNATPVPVDIDADTFCMDYKSFEQAVTPKTKAVIPVHMAGHGCNMDAICDIAAKHNLKVVEDASHAHGAEWKGRKIGTFGDASTFSFQNGKLVTSGEGGAVLTNSRELYEKAYLIHGVGRPKGDRVYQHLVLGSNYRMTEFQAAILIAQLERLEELNRKREENAKRLDMLLSDIQGITFQKRDPNVTLHSHYMYMFYWDTNCFGGISRQEFVDSLIAEGIPAFVSYPVVSSTEFFMSKNFRSYWGDDVKDKKYELPNSERVANEVVWLPHYTLLGDTGDIEEIAGAIKKIQSAVN